MRMNEFLCAKTKCDINYREKNMNVNEKNKS